MEPNPPGSTVRAGLIGDIHAEDGRLARCLERLQAERVDRILAVGDIVDGTGDVDRCCQLLQQAGALVVRGNHDRWLLEGSMRTLPDATQPADLAPETRAFIRGLPATIELQTVAGELLLCHGLGRHDMARLTPDDQGYALQMNFALEELLQQGRHRYVVAGHTHVRMERSFGRLTVVNPGSLSSMAEPPGFALLDLAQQRVRFFDL